MGGPFKPMKLTPKQLNIIEQWIRAIVRDETSQELHARIVLYDAREALDQLLNDLNQTDQTA